MRGSQWIVDPVRVLTRRELAAVLCDLLRKSAKSQNARINRTILRLACCCGLRVSEIAELRLGDVHVEGDRPHLVIRPEGAKGGRRRRVPLWWDAGTLADLKGWKAEREGHRAGCGDHFVCCLRPCDCWSVIEARGGWIWQRLIGV
jgi:integrase